MLNTTGDGHKVVHPDYLGFTKKRWILQGFKNELEC